MLVLSRAAMIPIPPAVLSANVTKRLRIYQAAVDKEPDFGKRVELAAQKFRRYNRNDNAVFRVVRSTLTTMCAGAKRCMYCEDSAADEVEHHRPKNLYPEHVFDWENYLYACGPCNGPKNNKYAVFRGSTVVDLTRKPGYPAIRPVAGDSVLLHPRTENPLDYMMLDVSGGTFLFVPTATLASREFERAFYTIKILRLNERDHLPVSRREAYASYRARVTEYGHKRDAGASATALGSLVNAIRRMQHPTVWREMCRQRAKIPELVRLFEHVPEALTW